MEPATTPDNAQMGAPVKAKPALLEATFERGPEAVETAHRDAYAAATNDPNPAYAGDVTPPLLAVRYHINLAKELISDPGLEVDLMRLVHGEQDMRFVKPIKAGDALTSKLQLTDVEHKESGSLMHLRFQLLRDGELVNDCSTTYFVRRKGGKKSKREAPPAVDDPQFTFAMTVRPEQSREYAEASLDINPIHVMDEFAQMAGFPGVILHGLCSLAFASQAVVKHAAGGDPERLASIKCRFSKPVLMGDVLTTRMRTNGDSVAFDVVNRNGVAIITSGEATVRA